MPAHPRHRSAATTIVHRVAVAVAVVLCGLSLTSAVADSDDSAPADLRLEWEDGTRSREPLRGRAGETVRVRYTLRNVGGRDAFAAIVSTHTALGRLHDDERLHPGPEAGTGVERSLRLAVAAGMRELCLEVRLQALEADEPADPNTEDNRLCCAIELEEEESAEERLIHRFFPSHSSSRLPPINQSSDDTGHRQGEPT